MIFPFYGPSPTQFSNNLPFSQAQTTNLREHEKIRLLYAQSHLYETSNAVGLIEHWNCFTAEVIIATIRDFSEGMTVQISECKSTFSS